jgi:hypothetical protein
MTNEIRSIIENHASGIEDRAGISLLDVWIAASRLDGNIANDQIARDLVDFVSSTNMEERGLWATVESLVRKLEINSPSLAEAIDTRIGYPSLQTQMRSFDIYCAWKAFIASGGAFYPRILNDRLPTLRSKAGPHWLDLAILAYRKDHQGLSEEICALAKDKLISAHHIEDRFHDISASVGSSNAAVVVEELAKVENSAFAKNIKEWAGTELGYKFLTKPTRRTTHEAQMDDANKRRIETSTLFKTSSFTPSKAVANHAP